jgi:hypothetical protein
MKKALCSFGVGPHKEYLDIARPSFQAFAKRHGYDYFECNGIQPQRPPAWYKIPLMRELLTDYDEVLFLGADTLIVDGREDLNVPAEYWQAMVNHHTQDGEVPNDDVWLVRGPMAEYLELIWNMPQYTYAPWWEQSALLELMGYATNERPCYVLDPKNKLYQHTCVLESGWNVHLRDVPQPGYARIQHATMWPDRAAIMREWAKQAEGWMNE